MTGFSYQVVTFTETCILQAYRSERVEEASPSPDNDPASFRSKDGNEATPTGSYGAREVPLCVPPAIPDAEFLGVHYVRRRCRNRPGGAPFRANGFCLVAGHLPLAD